MCESKIVLAEDGDREVVMEEAMNITINGDQITVVGLMGERREFKGNIKQIDLVEHEILIEPI